MIINMEIEYLYTTTNGQLNTLSISCEEYFDFEEGEIIDIETSPMHNKLIYYLTEEIRTLVKNIKLTLLDKNDKLIVEEAYWNCKNSFLINKKLYLNNIVKEEVFIIESEIEKNVFHVTRIDKAIDLYEVVHDVIITQNLDGSQTERSILIPSAGVD
jgi:hypothetical protein